METESTLSFEEYPISGYDFYCAFKPSSKYFHITDNNFKYLHLTFSNHNPYCLNTPHARDKKIWTILCGNATKPLLIFLASRA